MGISSSYIFFPSYSNLVKPDFLSFITFDIIENPHSPVLMQGANSEGNLCNVTQTIPIDMLVKIAIFEHVHIGQNYSAVEIETYMALFKEFQDVFAWSYEEIPRIDPSIVVHEIKTYPSEKPVRHKFCQFHTQLKNF